MLGCILFHRDGHLRMEHELPTNERRLDGFGGRRGSFVREVELSDEDEWRRAGIGDPHVLIHLRGVVHLDVDQVAGADEKRFGLGKAGHGEEPQEGNGPECPARE